MKYKSDSRQWQHHYRPQVRETTEGSSTKSSEVNQCNTQVSNHFLCADHIKVTTGTTQQVHRDNQYNNSMLKLLHNANEDQAIRIPSLLTRGIWMKLISFVCLKMCLYNCFKLWNFFFQNEIFEFKRLQFKVSPAVRI